MKKKTHTKPSGCSTLFKVSKNGTQETRVIFPKQKEEIENMFMSAFVDRSQKTDLLPFRITKYTHNAENDLDYIIHIQGQEEPLLCELTELAPESMMSRGYENTPTSYTVDEMTENLHKTIRLKYNYSIDSQSILLVYITHSSFNVIISEEHLSLIRSKLMTKKYKPNTFKYIFLLFFLDQDSLIIQKLYPTNIKRPSYRERSKIGKQLVKNIKPIITTNDKQEGDASFFIAQPQIIQIPTHVPEGYK
jgi:hypothetical protein